MVHQFLLTIENLVAKDIPSSYPVGECTLLGMIVCALQPSNRSFVPVSYRGMQGI